MKLSTVVAIYINVLLSEMAILSMDDHDADFIPPIWPKTNPYINDADEPIPIHLANSNDTCTCVRVPTKWSLCYGRNSCWQFPNNIDIETPLFRISATRIQRLHKGDFSTIGHLYSFDIEANYYLTTIEGGIFQNFSKLVNLSISYNVNLKSLENDTFQGLINLQKIFLVKNGFTRVPDASISLTHTILPSLIFLSLSENVFRDIGLNDFLPMSGTGLKELKLVLCQIDYIHPKCLVPLRQLLKLRIGQNTLSTITITDLFRESITNGINLIALNLYGVGFRKNIPKSLLKAISRSNITQLSMASNQFEVIDSATFSHISTLEYLDLREVLVMNISDNAFRGMPKLHTLLLSGNKLPNIPDGVLLQQLTYLDLSSNSGNSYFPSYFSLGKHKFIKMKNLKVLELSYNRITTVTRQTFQGLAQLTVAGLKNASIYNIEEGSFGPLVNLIVLNLQNNPIGKSGLTSKLFEGLVNLQVLLLGGCSITRISNTSDPFEHLSSLIHLGLEHNQLLILPPHVFKPLGRLNSLDVSSNLLTPWKIRLFELNGNLSSVLAFHNRFTYLSQAMLDDFVNLSRLDISNNPYGCECSTFGNIWEWTQNSYKTKLVGLIRRKEAVCVYPEKFRDISILQFLETLYSNPNYCFDYPGALMLLHYVVPLSLLIIALLCLAALAFFHRRDIRYWIFLAHIKLRRLGKGVPQITLQTYTNYQYDAFVSYSNEDKYFVIRLVTMLENFEPFLKLCVYERDFEIGSIISETVLENVSKSRRTLLVISDSYARSEWCRWELQIAQHHRIFFDNGNSDIEDSLVMIKLGDVSDAHMTPTLKYLLKTRIYLKWDADPQSQKIFWEKLRNTLARAETVFDSSV